MPNQLDLRLAFPYLQTLCNLTLFEHHDRNWARTFADAFRGIFLAFRSEKCFTVHFIATLLVIALSWWLEVTQIEALLLTFCVLGVLGLELINTAIERMADQVTDQVSPAIRDALDISSGAVLLAALGAVGIGGSIFIPKILRLINL